MCDWRWVVRELLFVTFLCGNRRKSRRRRDEDEEALEAALSASVAESGGVIDVSTPQTCRVQAQPLPASSPRVDELPSAAKRSRPESVIPLSVPVLSPEPGAGVLRRQHLSSDLSSVFRVYL